MGGAGSLKKRFESVLGGALDWQARPAPELVPTGVPEVDLATGGLPRGCLTEIYGPASSGRTTLLLSILARATEREEICALVDAEDAFDPASAAASGVRLDRLLWIRCAHSAEQALRSADLLIQGGGFGLVAMDLADTPQETARRISLTSWFRLRRAVENTPAVLLSVARQSNAKTCASLMLECARQGEHWERLQNKENQAGVVGQVVNLRAGCLPAPGGNSTGGRWRIDNPPQVGNLPRNGHPLLLRGLRVQTTRRKPGRTIESRYFARVVGGSDAGLSCGGFELVDDFGTSPARPASLRLAKE